ncbi:MAG: hypothetical protein ACLFR7_01795 [Opitutales bacterium]
MSPRHLSARCPGPASRRWRPRLSWRQSLALLPLLGLTLPASASSPSAPPPPAVSPQILANRPEQPPPEPPPSARPDASELFAQLRLLQEFLALSPAELERIRRTLTLIEDMDPLERDQMRARLARLQLDAAQIDPALETFAPWLTPSQRPVFRRFWLALTGQERADAIARFEALSAAARTPWIAARIARQEAREVEVRQALTEREASAEADAPE